MSTDGPLPILRDNQARASAPDAHVWLSASAGTGKTQVLAARVYRLLLNRVDPSAILCLTFTKAGAAEMAQRISERLAAWVRMPDAALRKDLFALGEDHLDPARLHYARTLFAKLLDAPGGGLRIQTIHSFCQSLLAAFPLEAGLVPGFRPIEAREEAVLAREALAELLVEAEQAGRGRVAEALGALSVRLGESGAESFLIACARAPDAMKQVPIWPDTTGWMRRKLGLPAGDIDAEIVAACDEESFDFDALHAIAAANRGWGTMTGGNRADIVECWIEAAPSMRATMLGDLVGVAFTGKREPRKYEARLIAVEPDYAEMAVELGEACARLLDLRDRAAYADLLAGALAVGRDYAVTYETAKRRAGAVDFDDLIRATLALLRQDGIGEWVRYKLDQATEHVLIDEAQDTNPRQWGIVRAIADEYFAGMGTRGERRRTLFTVGDFKQAIFSFQGTDPIFFRAAEEHFTGLAQAAGEGGGRFDRLSLTHSFRSTRPILEFVDAALDAIPEPGLGAMIDREVHASEVAGPGIVTLWPAMVVGGDEDAEPGDETWIDDATRALASRIARQVKAWLDDGLSLGRAGRDHATLRPEDVMILVKRRGELASLIVARLYAEGVPVAGIDRLRLDAPLAVQDLLATIRFVLQPGDDLSLASLLVSPLLGWSQDRLMAAAPRPGGTLWAHLRRTQDEASLAPLRAMLARADLTTPYRFLEELLSGPLDGRRKLLHRLGAEARDPIEELLNAALLFEERGTPSLQRFLDWFDRGEVEIKRDASAPLDAVRVMTAHGAKGLQAPLVILADATLDPTKTPRSTLNWDLPDSDEKLPIFRPRKGEAPEALAMLVEEQTARELAEHWRLFYVAATRAEEHLVIAGALGPGAKGVPPPASWYVAAEQALTTLGVPPGEGERRFEGRVPQRAAGSAAKSPKVPPPPFDLPEWARLPAPAEARPPRPLAPSSFGEDAVADPPPAPAMRLAAERGRLIHALFERLPPMPPADRATVADRWLRGAGGVVDAAMRAEIAGTVLTVIEDPRFAALFGPDSLGEAPIAATVGDGMVVSGTVDRLLVTPDRIAIVDFKTGRVAPATLDRVPDYHIRQMAAYAAALAAIFPGRTISAALLYTAGPALFELPADLLDRHKPGLAAAQQS